MIRENIKKYIISIIIFALSPAFLHYFLFTNNVHLGISFYLVYFQSLICFGLLFTFKKLTIYICLFFLSLIYSILLLWHQNYSELLGLEIIKTQLIEGIVFLKKSPISIFSLPIIFVWILFIFKLLYIKYIFLELTQKKGILRFVFSVPMVIFLAISMHNYNKNVFSTYNFNNYGKIFGYIHAWWYEAQTNFDRYHIIEDVIEFSYENVQKRKELSNIELASNVFIVQIESLDFAAFDKQHVMPFLNSIRNNSIIYKIHPRERVASAKSDFSVISSYSDYEKFYTAPYYILKKDMAQQINTIAKIMKNKGYSTSLFHGFIGSFYERKYNMKFLGFDSIFFEEDMKLNVSKGAWGYDDNDVINFMLNKQKQVSGKKFNFLITVSSHDPYDTPVAYKSLFNNPINIQESYLNTINYVDMALKNLITSSPKDSLFIIYSDHQSDVLSDTSTLLFIHSSQQKLTGNFEINFSQVPLIIKSILN